MATNAAGARGVFGTVARRCRTVHDGLQRTVSRPSSTGADQRRIRQGLQRGEDPGWSGRVPWRDPDYMSGANNLAGSFTTIVGRFFDTDRVTFKVTTTAAQAVPSGPRAQCASLPVHHTRAGCATRGRRIRERTVRPVAPGHLSARTARTTVSFLNRAFVERTGRVSAVC